MLSLKLFLLLTLISFSLQDSHCLITYGRCFAETQETNQKKAEKISNCEYESTYSGNTICNQCKDGYAHSQDSQRCVKFDNCIFLDGNDEKCSVCKEGYAVSYDQTKCISFPNCRKLQEGDTKCSDCVKHYHNNTEGKCERTLCSLYDENDKCTHCYDGYYLNKDKNCEKINIQYCLDVSSKDQNECTKCVGYLPIENKKCVIPEKLVEGCNQYDKDGKCSACTPDYEYKSGNCEFKGCSEGKKKYEYCGACEAGFYLEDGFCTSHKDGSKDTGAANINKIQHALIILILALLI